jgi:hypothetical protein
LIYLIDVNTFTLYVKISSLDVYRVIKERVYKRGMYCALFFGLCVGEDELMGHLVFYACDRQEELNDFS